MQSFEDVKKSRQKKTSFLMQVSKASESQPNQYDELMGTYDQAVSKNDKNIKQQLKGQSEQLQQRREMRKKNRQEKQADNPGQE